MTRYLLDTNVVSELRRARPDPAVLRWFDQARDAELCLSALTIGDIRLGIVRLQRRDRPVRRPGLSAQRPEASSRTSAAEPNHGLPLSSAIVPRG